ncbi:glutathione peroxidase [Martiniozyma asiatica (nom. inval.)]|nr:glutathione peroxidase [Martiniozyma asiatica]
MNVSNLSKQLQNVHLNEQQLQQQQQQQKQQCSDLAAFFEQPPPSSGFTLISHRSAPNGFKIAIILEELQYSYRSILLDFDAGDHRLPQFLQLNPNGRVPALIDHNESPPVSLWESGAIVQYLLNKKTKEDGFCPNIWSDNLIEQSQILSWLFFQTSGHAPMIGQALHFKYFHSISVPSAVDRYVDEVRRVYGVVEMALSERREALIMELDADNAASYSAGLTPLSQSRYFNHPVWLVGDRCTVADLCFVPWNYVVDRVGIDIKAEFPEVYKWTRHMMGRPGVARALKG